MPTQQLGAVQRTRYEGLKLTIRNGLDSLFTVANALLEIRNSKLYLDEYDTFKEFCQQEYQMAEQRAYQLLNYAEMLTKLPSETLPRLSNERQARALVKVPEPDRARVLEVAGRNGPLTARKIEAAAKEQKAQQLDKTGHEIPDEILDNYLRACGVQELLTAISQVKVAVQKALADDDICFCELSNTTVAHLKNAYGDLQRVIPYSVCPYCSGKTHKSCTNCKKRGFVSKFFYETCIPDKIRAIWEKKK